MSKRRDPLTELIYDISRSTAPSRILDGRIAIAIGYNKQSNAPDPANPGQTRVIWLSPTGDIVRLPFYTSNLVDAWHLAQTVAPSNVGGCSWEDGKGSARLDDDPYFQSISPEMALCLSSLARLRANRQNDGIEEGDSE